MADINELLHSIHRRLGFNRDPVLSKIQISRQGNLRFRAMAPADVLKFSDVHPIAPSILGVHLEEDSSLPSHVVRMVFSDGSSEVHAFAEGTGAEQSL